MTQKKAEKPREFEVGYITYQSAHRVLGTQPVPNETPVAKPDPTPAEKKES